jgi:hypothetical protein
MTSLPRPLSVEWTELIRPAIWSVGIRFFRTYAATIWLVRRCWSSTFMLWKSFVRLADGAVVGPARRYEGDRLEVKLASNTWMFGLADHFWLASNSRGGTNAFQASLQLDYDAGGCAPKRQFRQQPASGERILTVTRSFGGVLRSRTLATASAKYYTPDGKLIYAAAGPGGNAGCGA